MMTNLTIAMDEQLIKQARVRAIQEGTSVSAKVREFLQQYVKAPQDEQQRQRDEETSRLMEALQAAAAQAHPAPADKTAPRRSLREEMYEGDFRARARQAAQSSGG